VISKNRNTNKVIIYKQDTKNGEHEIYIGVPVELIDSDEKGRLLIKMVDVKPVGTTTANWNEFTGTSQGALRIPLSTSKEIKSILAKERHNLDKSLQPTAPAPLQSLGLQPANILFREPSFQLLSWFCVRLAQQSGRLHRLRIRCR
jgi:hypothetical protein